MQSTRGRNMLKDPSGLVPFRGVLVLCLLMACSSKDGGNSPTDQRPKAVSAVPGPGAGQITVSWDPLPIQPSAYNLSVHPIRSGTSRMTTVTGVTSPCVVTVRSPDIRYPHELFVTAVYNGSEYASESLTAIAIQRESLPGLVPQNLKAVPGPEKGQITVSWDLHPGNPRYELYAHASSWVSGADVVLEDATPPAIYTAADADLTVAHTFSVKAIIADTEGLSASVTAYPL